MRTCISATVVAWLLAAVPALAAPCKTSGTAGTPIAFPKNDATDMVLARSMLPLLFPETTNALPKGPGCSRMTVKTASGEYAVGGEDGDAFPRVALRLDGQAGPVVYLTAIPGTTGPYALVVHAQEGLTVAKTFYQSIPTDARLAADIVAALADSRGLMAVDQPRQQVMYAFLPPGTSPPAERSGPRPGGSAIIAGPQIFIPNTGDRALLDVAGLSLRHRPSGFACPQLFDDLPVRLMTLDPRADALICGYRVGTDPEFQPGTPVRYQITLIRAKPGDTQRGLFDQLKASAIGSIRIKRDHVLPLPTGQAPGPAFAAFWETEVPDVQGMWVGRAAGWLVWVRAQYPAGAANDVEAGKVAERLFAALGSQVK